MQENQPHVLFDALAVSSTTTYKSKVVRGDRPLHIAVKTTGTATGTLTGECNDMPDAVYQAAVVAAGSEAANTAGWVPESFLQTPSGGAFTGAAQNTAAEKVAVSGPTTATAILPAGPRRRRLSYTNATNTGVVTAYAQQN